MRTSVSLIKDSPRWGAILSQHRQTGVTKAGRTVVRPYVGSTMPPNPIPYGVAPWGSVPRTRLSKAALRFSGPTWGHFSSMPWAVHRS